jgi:hypothetical protein
LKTILLRDDRETRCAQAFGDFGKLIAEETKKWGKVIRALNIKAD